MSIQPDPKEKKEYLDAVGRERQRFDDNLRQQREQREASAGSAQLGYPNSASRSPSTSHRGMLPETYRIDTPRSFWKTEGYSDGESEASIDPRVPVCDD